MKSRNKNIEKAKSEFAHIRSMLYLNHYTLNFSKKKPNSADAAAEIHVSRTRAVASLRLGDAFFTATKFQRRHYVIHELLHIYFAELDYLYDTLRNYVPAVTWREFYENYNNRLERAVDGLADVLDPLSALADAEIKRQKKKQKKERRTKSNLSA